MVGKLLGFASEALAKRLRDEFPPLPARVEHLIFGFITPIAAEFVRRVVWRTSTLTTYEKVQLYMFMLRAYAFIIREYGNRFEPTEEVIDAVVRAPIAPPEPNFAERMARVRPMFDRVFSVPDLSAVPFVELFANAFLMQCEQILRQRSGYPDYSVAPEDCARLLLAFEDTNATIQPVLARTAR